MRGASDEFREIHLQTLNSGARLSINRYAPHSHAGFYGLENCGITLNNKIEFKVLF